MRSIYVLCHWGAAVYLEASRAPIDELNGLLSLDRGDSSLCVLRCDITSVQQAASHVLALSRITLNHLASRFEA